MEETILKAILNFGIFPAVTIYIVLIVIKDLRKDLSDKMKLITDLKKEIQDTREILLQRQYEIEQDTKKIIEINEQTQTFLNQQLSTILIRLLDVLDDLEKK